MEGVVRAKGPTKSFKGTLLYLPKNLRLLLDIKDNDLFAYQIEYRQGKIVVVLTKLKDPSKIIELRED